MRWLVTFLVFFVAFPPHVYAAVITSSIGSGKDYATVTLWEADSYGATAADSAIGEVYGTIAESSGVKLDDTTPTAITLTSASGERHDGTKGSFATIDINVSAATGFYADVGTVPITIDWLQFDGAGWDFAYFIYLVNLDNGEFSNNLVWGPSSTISRAHLSAVIVVETVNTNLIIHNNAIWGFSNANPAYGIRAEDETGASLEIYNNTIYDIESTGSSDDAYGIKADDDPTRTIKNNLVKTISSTSGTAYCYGLGGAATMTTATNGADDTTSPDDGDYDSMTIAFEDAANGDFTIADGSETAVKTGGTDLGTTANIDLTGRDRDSEGDTWSLGAIQYVSAGEPAARRIMLIQ